jgi:cation:H+ antiporter
MDFYFISLVICFFLSAIVTWLAGIALAKTTDTLDSRFRIGDALGGLILLGISGSLPEIAIAFSAAFDGQIPVIIGTLLGGLAIQTLVIVIFDLAVRNKKPLSYISGSPMLALETYFTIIITMIALIGTTIPAYRSFYNINPMSIMIVLAWFLGLVFINKARKNPSLNRVAVDAKPGRRHHERRAKPNHPFYANRSTIYVVIIFLTACILTLVAGVFLEKTGTVIANQIGMSTSMFAATFIALVASLPEISTGLESILIGDNQLAISDIMGGNSFMLTIFLFTDLIASKPVLSYAGTPDILLALLGIILMAIYAAAFLRCPDKRYFRLGIDSLLATATYFIGFYAIGLIK